MALPSRTAHIPAGLGIDEATRPELLQVGAANVTNQNVRMYETNALEKRFGTTPMSAQRVDGTSRTSGFRMITRDDRACVIDANASLDQYVPTIGKWSSSGPIPEAVYSLQPVPSPTADATVLDSATTSGMIAIAYARADDQAALMAVIDATDGSVISPITILGSGSYDRGIHAVGAIKDRYFIAITSLTLETEIHAYVFDTQSVAAGWVSLGTIESAQATPYPSICQLDDRIVVAYGISTGGNRVIVKAVDNTGVVDSTALLATTTPTFVDVDGSSSDVVWVIFDNPTAPNIRAAALTPTAIGTALGSLATVFSAPFTDDLRGIRVCAGSTHNAQVWCTKGPTGSSGVNAGCITVAAGVTVRGQNGTASGTRFAAYPAIIITSRPFYRDGLYYAFVGAGTGDLEDDANYQANCILVDWTMSDADKRPTHLRPVANIEPGLAPRLQIWSKVYALDTSRWVYARQFLTAGSEHDNSASYGASLVVLDFASSDRWRAVDHHGVTLIGGGVVGVWDGADFTELGFIARPNPPTVAKSTGSLTGTFRYVAIYEDVDAAGNVTVSGVSNPTDLVTLTGEDANISTQACVVTYRRRTIGVTAGLQQARVRTILYRTVSGGEPPYYRLGPNTTAVVDSTSDADLVSRPKLYAPNLPGAVGEALDRRAPPQLTHLVSYNGMLVGAKGASLFWSGQEVYGEATWFNPAFELPVSGGGGGITGLAVQDGAIVVFKRDRVFIVAGESPSDNGAAGGLGEARLVSSDWGCIDANSIVATQIGVFFQSERGIEIFSRAQSVEWIGEAVLDTLTAFPVVTSATNDARSSLVRFTLAAGVTSGLVDVYEDHPPTAEVPGYETGGGRDIVFDLSKKTWISVDVRDSREAAQSAAYVNVNGRRYAWLGTDGLVHVENDRGEPCRDSGVWIPASYTISPFTFGLQQEQRSYEWEASFEKVSAADLVIEVAENYGDFAAVTADKEWISTATDGQRMVPFRTKSHGNAVQLRVSDRVPTDEGADGRGFIFIGLSTDAAPKQGVTRGTTRGNTELRR